MLLNTRLAQVIGRPDLSGVAPIDPYGGTSGNPQVGAAGSIAAGLSFPGGSLAANTAGRLTAGVLVVILAVVIGGYIWTRNLQS